MQQHFFQNLPQCDPRGYEAPLNTQFDQKMVNFHKIRLESQFYRLNEPKKPET